MSWLRNGMRTAIAGIVLGLVLQGTAGAAGITSGFTGNWYNPESVGQGFQFEVVEVQGQTELLAFWFLFDADGNLLWLFGQGPVDGNTATMDLFQQQDGVFGQPVPSKTRWGTVTFHFDDCNNGQVEFEQETPGKAEQIGSGIIGLKRVSQIKSADCTGGVSDDLPARAVPQDLEVNLAGTDAAPGATGRLEFEVRPGHAELQLEVRGLPTGDYELALDGNAVAPVSADAEGEGDLKLESPPGPASDLLDFDPRGHTITVEAGGTVFLSADVPQQGTIPGAEGANPPPFGNSEIEFALANQDVFPGGKAKAELEQEDDRVDFKVEVEDIPVGDYDLRVGGQLRATITVSAGAGENRGEVEFRFPADPGKLLLDFNPLGKTVAIEDQGTVLFSGDAAGGAGDDSGGDGSGGGGSGGDDSGGGGGSGGSELQLAIALQPVNGSASGDAEYRRDADGTRLKVQIEDVADGSYGLEVGGVHRADIQVSGGEGEVEFRDPPEAGKLPLDFDPLGKTIKVSGGGGVILQGTLPNG